MRPLLEFLLALALIISLAFLMVRGTAEVAAQRRALEEKINELLQREQVTLADFIQEFGEPKSLSVVSCEGQKCLKASWDLSYATRECWKRLIVVLNEEAQRVFFAELKDLVVIQRTDEGMQCAEAPE